MWDDDDQELDEDYVDMGGEERGQTENPAYWENEDGTYGYNRAHDEIPDEECGCGCGW